MTLYSSIDPTQLLHIINRKRDIQQGRTDLVPSDEMLQVAAMKIDGGTTYKAHKHIEKDLPSRGHAQEMWVVLSGLVEVILYDIDDTVLHKDILEAGDFSLTLSSAHNYRIMGDNAIVLEIKSGPYSGQLNDKVFV